MSPRQRVFRLVALVAYVVAISATMLLAGHTRAQPSCNPQWQPFDPSTATISGADGQVWAATEWDPDGAGPEGLKIVIGGEFAIAGSVLANKVAAFDPATGEWSAFGSGIGGSTSNLENRVIALCAMPDGRLVAAGKFYSAGSQSAASIAVWNGDEWSALGSGINNTVTCVAAMPNGDIIAGGYFTAAGGIPALNIA
ncbi:MAG TPA: hypothetical protein VHN77_07835, partial [Phycisphaerales bacterium]|nr:hypothetical protein [Phycisphaerales bacterium]